MPEKNCLAVRHVNFEGLGVLGGILRERGYHTHYVDAHDPSLTVEKFCDAGLAVVLGGPHAVYDADKYVFLASEIECVKARLLAEKPILGICLGAQIMTAAMAGHVRPSGAREFGWSKVELTPEGQSSVLAPIQDLPILHWHGDNCELAPGATLLAYNGFAPVQAFCRKPHQLALQFHLETGPERIEGWLTAYEKELALFKMKPDAIRTQAQKFGDAALAAGRKVFSAWLDHVEALP